MLEAANCLQLHEQPAGEVGEGLGRRAVAAGRADLCALARPHLSDPFWTLHAAAQFGYADQPWPVQYLTGKQQLEREISRKAATP